MFANMRCSNSSRRKFSTNYSFVQGPVGKPAALFRTNRMNDTQISKIKSSTRIPRRTVRLLEERRRLGRRSCELEISALASSCLQSVRTCRMVMAIGRTSHGMAGSGALNVETVPQAMLITRMNGTGPTKCC